jgi:hypothetical protein
MTEMMRTPQKPKAMIKMIMSDARLRVRGGVGSTHGFQLMGAPSVMPSTPIIIRAAVKRYRKRVRTLLASARQCRCDCQRTMIKVKLGEHLWPGSRLAHFALESGKTQHDDGRRRHDAAR